MLVAADFWESPVKGEANISFIDPNDGEVYVIEVW